MTITIVAIVWSIIGVLQFIMPIIAPKIIFKDPTILELFSNLPNWYRAMIGVATISGLAASILQFLRKRTAKPLFLVSMIIGFLVEAYWLLGTNAIDIFGENAILMPMIVVIFSIALYALSKLFVKKGWLN